MKKCFSLVLFVFVLTLSMIFISNASSNQTECAGMFSKGILKADASTLSSTSHLTDLEAYKAVIGTSRAWCADPSDIYQYIQVNLGRLRNITAIYIQGYVTYVKKFVVTYTVDDVTWKYYYEDERNNIKVFLNSPANDNEVVNHPLPSILSALRIRIKPQEWESWICMRIELITCDPVFPVDGGFSGWSSWTDCNNGNQLRSRSCDSPLPVRGGLNCSGNFSITRSCSQNVTDPCVSDPCMNGSQCIWPDVTSSNYTCNYSDGSMTQNRSRREPSDCAGMFTSGILKAEASTLSSTSHSSDLEAYKAIVSTSRAWCAHSSDIYQYLQVNLGRLRNISAIDIQGYNPGFPTYVKKFIITYTVDDVTWNYYEDESNNIKVFLNSPANDNEVVNHPLPSILSALRIRIKPQEWEGWICMRIELITCDPVDGGFSGWSYWTDCNNGVQLRSRSCNSPLPVRGGLNCSGNFSITRSCMQNVTDPCVSDPCMNGSRCIWPDVTSSNYTCNCSDGPVAQNCSHREPLGTSNATTFDLGANLTLQNFTDPCSFHPCQNASSCTSFIKMSKADYTCNCTEGFSGKNCSHFDFEFWEFVPSQEMHKYKNVVLPIAVSVASSALISGSFGIIYFMAKSRISKIVPTRNIVV